MASFSELEDGTFLPYVLVLWAWIEDLPYSLDVASKLKIVSRPIPSCPTNVRLSLARRVSFDPRGAFLSTWKLALYHLILNFLNLALPVIKCNLNSLLIWAETSSCEGEKLPDPVRRRNTRNGWQDGNAVLFICLEHSFMQICIPLVYFVGDCVLSCNLSAQDWAFQKLL